jgi:hypothetical protein
VQWDQGRPKAPEAKAASVLRVRAVLAVGVVDTWRTVRVEVLVYWGRSSSNEEGWRER